MSEKKQKRLLRICAVMKHARTTAALNLVEVSGGGLEALVFLFPCRFFALTSLRLLCLLASGLAVLVFVDTWRKKIWPQIKGATTRFF